MKVIASTLRKGNVVDKDGKLYVILTVENIHPARATPVTQLDMRRITDGVKVSERYRTTESVERAFVEDREHTFLYEDGEGFHFMNPENYDQVAIPKDVIGDAAPYLQEGMAVMVSTHNGVALTIELPQRVVLEITETEPAMKGQTASSSYKPAILSNVRAHRRAASHRGGHPRGDHDRGRLLRGARQGLTSAPERRPPHGAGVVPSAACSSPARALAPADAPPV